MHIYECSYGPTEIKDIPELDCWTGLLGNTDRGIPDDKPLIIDATTGSQFSYGQGRKLALQLADGLRNTAGLKAGDVVCLFSPNSALYPIVCMAIQAAGLVATLANPTYTQNEFLHQLRDSSAKLVLAGSDLLPPALQAANEAGVPNDRIYALPGMDGKVKSGAQSYEKLISKTLWEHEPSRGADLDRAAYLPYSSGTTGLPKGVNVSHRNVIAMSEMLVVTPDLVKQDTVVMGVLPMCHIFAITMTMHHPLRMGATIVILPKFDLAAFLSNIEKYKCTFTCIVPPMALALARHPIVDKANLSSLKEIICGAAPLSADLAAEVTKRVKVPLHQGWGMTETTAASTVNRPGRDKHGSTGQLLPGQQARIVKEDGRDAEVGRDGELWVRGPNIVKSYHNNQKATKGTFTEGGWLMTGDVGFFDAEGYLKIIDRTKELIKYKGYQVAPAELEAILLTCELVADAAVIGVWSENDASELPRAYVVLSDKGKADASHKKSIQTFVQDRVAPSKRLRGGVHTIDVIPKSLSGKILRKDLRTMAAKEGQTKAKL